ncbi:MAG: hypothetical protein CL714_04350 [Chloroflexi bacterium]|jgi:hypothetical protein|nr:hypothetical protein [Chloroflexota bacterium]MBF16473.1 hypothetical protein [Chloroflexota bacterium]MBR91594.1 hypothetical protein [Dehalococcoidia bacterium]|tara:strand:- start:808 stop:987 length:180 start_codon:yes stop_codon:yes gene_type:complete
MKNFTSFTWLYMVSAFLSFLISVALWFFADDAKLEAIFVGIWVPSIISLGSALERKLDE